MVCKISLEDKINKFQEVFVVHPVNIKIIDGKKKPTGISKKWTELTKSVPINTDNFCVNLNKDYICIDIDMAEDKDGIKSLLDAGFDINDFIENQSSNVLITKTIRNGYHLYFIMSEYAQYNGLLNGVKTLSGIDTKYIGGMCFEGKGYELLTVPDDLESIDEIPNELVDALMINKKVVTLKEIDNNYVEEDAIKIKELLSIIDIKYCDDYDCWVKIGMAIKNIIHTEEIAYELFDTFSQQSGKYDYRECCKKFYSLKDDGDIKIGSLCKYAKESNEDEFKKWQQKYASFKKNRINRFDLYDFYTMSDFVSHLNNTMFDTSQELLDYVKQNLYKVCVRCTSERLIFEKEIDTKGVCKIKYYHMDNWGRNIYAHFKSIENGELKVKDINLYTLVLRNVGIINDFKCLSYEIQPNMELSSNDIFYVGYDIQAKYINYTQEDLDSIQSLFDVIKIAHCSNNEQYYSIYMKYLGYIVRNLNSKSGKFLVLYSKDHGTGKSSVSQFMGKYIFGKNLYHSVNELEKVTNEKNQHLSGKKFISIEEASCVKGTYKAQFNKLKDLITSDQISIRELYKDTRQEEFYGEFILTTNNIHAVPIEKTDRRYIVLEVQTTYLNDTKFWKSFSKNIFNNHAGDIFYSYLMDLNVTEDEFRSIDNSMFDTDIKQELKDVNKSSCELFYEYLKDNLQDTTDEHYNFRDLSEPFVLELLYKKDQIKIKTPETYNLYKLWCSGEGESAMMKKYFNLEFGKIAKKIKTNGIRYYTIQTLS